MKEEEKNISNNILHSTVDNSTDLKELLVTYVGKKLNPENKNVTVEMIIEVMAQEFPEFLMAYAEENFIRGYEQAHIDIDAVANGLKEMENDQS